LAMRMVVMVYILGLYDFKLQDKQDVRDNIVEASACQSYALIFDFHLLKTYGSTLWASVPQQSWFR